MKAAEWIDHVKKARGWETDYRVAKELRVSSAALSRYRTQPDATMDDIVASKVAEALDLEPHILIMDQVAERTPVEAARKGLDALLTRLTKRKGPRLGGGGVVDITSAASTAESGQPDDAPGRTRPEYTSYLPTPARQVAPLQWLAQQLQRALVATTPFGGRRLAHP